MRTPLESKMYNELRSKDLTMISGNSFPSISFDKTGGKTFFSIGNPAIKIKSELNPYKFPAESIVSASIFLSRSRSIPDI